MKIAIGINIYGEEKRHDLCIESLIRISSKYPEVSLYNIQQKVQRQYNINLKFDTLYDNGITAKDVVSKSISTMPIINGFFDALATIDCDYFIFLNDDIILNDNIIELVLKNIYDTISVSRLAIQPITSLQDTNIKHSHLQIAGFDVWVIKKDWWLTHKDKFPKFIYATSAWDVAFSSIMMCIGNSLFYNIMPPGCYHIIHPEKSHNDTPERHFNFQQFEEYDMFNIWHKYLYKVLEERQKLCPNYTKKWGGENDLITDTFKYEAVYPTN